MTSAGAISVARGPAATLRVVLVGTGFVAPLHVAGWRACPDVEVVAAVTRHPGSAWSRLAELGIARAYATLAEAIAAERPDIVDICSPPARHVDDCLTAIGARCDFMCQKPLAPTLEGALAVAAAARAAGVRAMVHENFRFRRWCRALSDVMASGEIGKPFYARMARRMAGTVRTAAHPEVPWSLARQPQFAAQDPFLILESMIHQIDVARFLFGEPTRLFARARRISPLVAAEDTALVVLSFPETDVVIERSYASKGYLEPKSGGGEQVAVEGEHGSAFVEGDGTLRIVTDGPGGRHEREIGVGTAEPHADSYRSCIAHFVARRRDGRPFETSLDDNIRTLHAVFAAYRSAETGQAIELGRPSQPMEART